MDQSLIQMGLWSYSKEIVVERILEPFKDSCQKDCAKVSGRASSETDMTPHEAILELQRRMETAIIGQQHVIQRLLLTLLCNGNCLLEGLAGSGQDTRREKPGAASGGGVEACPVHT